MEPIVNIPIRVLIIEDTDDDKELVLRHLKKGGYIPEYECIQTREELIYTLDNQNWDLILCDYSMPKFDGLTALRIVKQKAKDIPFILISGTVGEEIAVEAMKAGAQDYLMKDNLIRLIPLIKRELEEFKIHKEKKIADEEIRNQNVVLDAIINNSHSIIIFMIDNEYRYVSFNENHRKEMKLLYNVDIELGMNMLNNITIPEIKKKAKATIDKVLSGESFIQTEVQPNINIYYEMHWNAVRKDEQIIGASCFVVNITERKKSELELIAAKEKAEESDRLKSAFLANMSHEIRTPMNGILGFSNLLKEPKLTGEQQQKYIGIIEKSGARMLNIINDIVDISKIEAGLTTMDITESDINEQLEYIYTFFRPEVEAKGMKLSLKNTLPSKEAIIKTDREKVFAILTNLVKNAIKYSNKGFIEFGYNLKGNALHFFVKDTGIGIPKNRQENIFERFIQADIEDKMARQGAGLGLTITKAYVEMLGGSIWVESQEEDLATGKVGGSTFYFTLPYNPSYKQGISSENMGESSLNFLNKNLKILIVEDDESSEMLLEIMVENITKKIIKAKTGLEAMEAYKNNPDIDLIMMDIQLPKMNGYEVTRQIRKLNKEVIIIAQTAYGFSDDKEKAIKAGCNDYISKPIKQDDLFVLIQKYFNK